MSWCKPAGPCDGVVVVPDSEVTPSIASISAVILSIDTVTIDYSDQIHEVF